MVEYVTANPTTDQTSIDGFVEAYKEAFGGAPYFENYSTEEVMQEIWQPHIEDGIVVLATETDQDQVVGFGCAVPLRKAPDDIQECIDSANMEGVADIDAERSWYMSELGVLEAFRGRGIGYNLVKHRLQIIKDRGDTQYVFRTAAEGSNSIHLYRKIGAQLLPRSQDISESDQVTVNGSQSTSRVYLFGECEVALSIVAGRTGPSSVQKILN